MHAGRIRAITRKYSRFVTQVLGAGCWVLGAKLFVQISRKVTHSVSASGKVTSRAALYAIRKCSVCGLLRLASPKAQGIRPIQPTFTIVIASSFIGDCDCLLSHSSSSNTCTSVPKTSESSSCKSWSSVDVSPSLRQNQVLLSASKSNRLGPLCFVVGNGQKVRGNAISYCSHASRGSNPTSPFKRAALSISTVHVCRYVPLRT